MKRVAAVPNETIDFAIRLGLCFTPVRSPQSNGMAEALVKTFKRDYVYVHDRHDAQTRPVTVTAVVR